MPRFKLTLTYEYDADPANYFYVVPAEITPGVIQKMVNIDSQDDNIHDFINYILETGEYEGVIEAVG